MTDILVFTPVYRLENETVTALFALEHDGPLSIMLQRDNPGGGGIADHLHQYQRGRELFLSGPFDAMLVIESDIVPPTDTITRLLALQSDVGYGCYVMRPGGPVNVLERYSKPARNVGEPLTSRGLWESAQRAGVVECSGSGLGCILIRRHVLESVPFEVSKGGGYFDYDWTCSVYKKGYSMMADIHCICHHLRPEGAIRHVG